MENLFEVKVPVAHLNVEERLEYYAKEIGRAIDDKLVLLGVYHATYGATYWKLREENTCNNFWSITVTSLKPEDRDPEFVTFRINHQYPGAFLPEKAQELKQRVIDALGVGMWNKE